MSADATSPVVALSDLAAFLNEFLEVDRFEDYGPNGLQVEGRPSVRKIVTGVSACVELFEKARASGADAVLVHHGLFWQGQSAILTGAHRQRVKTLLDADLSLLAYHLPLDAHPDVGNNARAAAALGLEALAPFGLAKGRPVGLRGSFDEPVEANVLVSRCEQIFDQRPLALGAESRQIASVAIVSGGAQALLPEAIAAGVDAFITGEASEWVTNLARESGLLYLAAGHHATEKLGVKALGERVAERYGIEVDFIDVPNPV